MNEVVFVGLMASTGALSGVTVVGVAHGWRRLGREIWHGLVAGAELFREVLWRGP